MKKALMLAISIFSLTYIVKAQNKPIRLGIKAGANLTTLGSLEFLGEKYDYKYRPGFTAGVFGELPLGNNFYFVPEINYSEKGGKLKETVEGTTGEINQKVNYIDVPIAFSYNLVPSLRIFAGPQISFLLSQRTKIYVNGEQQGEDNTDSKDIVKTLVGGVAGLSYNFTDNINLNGRYMMDLQDGYKGDAVGFDKVKNSGFAFTIGYKF